MGSCLQRHRIRPHCGNFTTSLSKAWVSVISKSIEISEADLKEVKKRVPATYNKEQTLKELAHKIVRSIQNMEADLLLELAHYRLIGF